MPIDVVFLFFSLCGLLFDIFSTLIVPLNQSVRC